MPQINFNPLGTQGPQGFFEGYTQGQKMQEEQLKLDQLRQDYQELTQLRAQLKAAGQNDDPMEFFKVLRQSGNPEYVAKGYEGMQRYQQLKRNEQLLRREAPELFETPAPAGAAAPAAAPTGGLAGMTFGGQVGPAPAGLRVSPEDKAYQQAADQWMMGGMQGPAPTRANALAPAGAAPAAPTNALAAAPGAAPAAPVNAMIAPQGRVQELRRKIMLYSSSGDPKLEKLAEVYKGELQELTKTHTVGGRIVSGAGNVLYTAPSEMGALEQEIEALRASGAPANDPRIVARQNKITKLSTHAPGTTMVNVQEKAEAGKYGELLVKQYDDISKQAGVAAKTLPSIEANLTTLNKGLDTGFGTEAKAAGARILGALGVQGAEKLATDTQTFQSNAINAVLQKQFEQKGPQTESDARRIEQVGAQLGNTKDANRFILDLAREQLRRDIEQRNFYANWKKGPGKGSFEGAEDAWFAGEGGKSLFDRPALKKYAPGPSAVQQIPGQRPAPAAAPAAAPAVTPNIDALLRKYQ